MRKRLTHHIHPERGGITICGVKKKFYKISIYGEPTLVEVPIIDDWRRVTCNRCRNYRRKRQ